MPPTFHFFCNRSSILMIVRLSQNLFIAGKTERRKENGNWISILTDLSPYRLYSGIFFETASRSDANVSKNNQFAFTFSHCLINANSITI